MLQCYGIIFATETVNFGSIPSRGKSKTKKSGITESLPEVEQRDSNRPVLLVVDRLEAFPANHQVSYICVINVR